MNKLCVELEEMMKHLVSAEWHAEYFYSATSSKLAFMNYTGFADYFKKEAITEHHHAKRMIDYLRNRGYYPEAMPLSAPKEPKTLLEALTFALELEEAHTEYLKQCIQKCKTFNDPHLEAFLLTFLENQFDSLVDLADHIQHLDQLKLDDNTSMWFYYDRFMKFDGFLQK